MKKLACVALCAGVASLAVGCTTDDGGPPTILFDWSPASDCPDLTAANRESTVIINGQDFDNVAADEQLLFDCEDGASGVITIQDGDWDFDLEVVDQYSDSTTIDPFDCFDETTNGDECLYYTVTPSRVEGVDTFIDYDPDVLVDFAYGYGNFTVDYTVDASLDLAQVDPDCIGFGEFGAEDLSIAITFYDGAGLVEDLFACGQQGVDTRDLPLGVYAPAFDLLDSTGAAINQEPAIPNTTNGELELATHLDNILIEVNIDEFAAAN